MKNDLTKLVVQDRWEELVVAFRNLFASSVGDLLTAGEKENVKQHLGNVGQYISILTVRDALKKIDETTKPE